MAIEPEFDLSDLSFDGPPVDLHPDLRPYVNAHSVIGQVLQHPLLYSVPYHAITNRMLNRQYDVRLAAVNKAVAQKEWAKVIFLHERPYRVEKLRQYAETIMAENPILFWEMVGETWTDTENVWQCGDIWEELWERLWAEDEIKVRSRAMNDTERTALGKLPDQLTVFRGIQFQTQTQGLSWTLDRAKAEWFASRYSRPESRPKLLIGLISKDDVIAHFLGRNEKEIVAFPESVKIIKTVPVRKKA